MDEPFDTHNRCHLLCQSVAAQARGLGWLVAWLSGWLTCVLAGPLSAQVYDAYEGGSPRWRLVESDSQAQVTLQEISPSMPRSGQTSELVELLCTNGTFAYLAIPIEPATIIDELAPSVWVQCMSGRIRLGANVVFPNAPHPVTGGRLHAILWGDTYDSPGQWQRLALTNCVKQLSQETIALRQRYGPKLDLEGAYIDSLVLNAYTGPGRYRIKIDDLSLQGVVSIASLGQMVPADWRSEWRWRDGSVHDEQRWLQGNNWRVPVWWQYQGESLPWLHALGFRGVLLNRFPTPELLQEIRSARLAVISPPPSTALTSEDKAWDTVQGWMVGAALDGRSLDQLRAETNRVEQFPEALRRATIAEALEEYWAFSRAVDELVIPAPSPLSAGTAVEKSQWLVQSLQNASKRSSGWVSVTTDALPSWAAQVETARKWVEPGSTELELVDAGQLRLQVARSVAAGSRGFLFRSSVPLDISHVDHQVRVAAMRTINRDLEFMSPWISNGQTAPIPKLDRADFDAAAWTASRSLLVMLINNTPENQHCLPPTRQTPLRATMPLPSGIKNVLRITSGVPQSLLLQPSTEGMSWEIRDPGAIELCVLTDNPVVERYVTRLTSQSADEYAEDCLDIASHQLQLASRVTSVRWPDVADELPRRYLSTVAAGQQRVDQGYQELRARRPGRAVEAAAQAYDAAQMIIFESYQTAISNLAAPQASPFVLNPATLPYHWLLAQSCARSSWRSVPLPGNELQSLDSMLQAGWSQQRRQTTRAEMLVELVPASTDNSPGLRLAALAKTAGGLPGGYEGATVRVRSAAAQVNKGELLRLTARATVRRAPQQPGAGLLVYDNYAGPALGQLVRGTTGETIAIELYRFATDETPLRLLTELRGECDIVIDNIAVSAIQPAINASNYPTNYKYIPTNPPDSSLDR